MRKVLHGGSAFFCFHVSSTECKLDYNGRCAGHSGTSFLAMEYAIKYPKHVQKVVLCDTTPTNSVASPRQECYL